jgi:ketosteroid isomerase-like protein
MSLLDQLACARLTSLWTHYIDRHDIEAAVALFADDGILHSRTGAVLKGHDAIRTGLSKRDSNRVTRHVLAPPTVQLTGPDTAEGIAEYILFDAYKDQHPGKDPLPIESPVGVGEFHQTYRRATDGWQITSHNGASVFRRPEA